MQAKYPLFIAAIAALLGAPAAAQLPISPRLFAGTTKSLAGPPALLIPAEGRQLPAIPGAETLPDGSVLARLSQPQLEAIAGSGALAWAMPQQPVLPPDDLPAPPMPVAKAFRPILPGNDGRGVRIGVIEFDAMSADNAALAQVATRWPARRLAAAGSNTHSDRVVGLIHRHAPAAELHVVTLPASATEQDVIRAARRLADQGVRIINFSGASYGHRRDGSAPLDRIVAQMAARGILFVTVAGNDALRSWQAPLQDANRDGEVDAGAAGLWLEASGGAVRLQLSWDDWGPAGPRAPAGTWDLDMEIYDAAGRLIDASRTRRGLIGEPLESLDRVVLAPGRYRVRLPYRAIGIGLGRPLVQLVATGAVAQLLPSVANGSVAIPGTSRGAFTVGARDGVREAAYSGRGPTLDGRAKPDILANGAGEAGLQGTSYAAPRIAGLAARLLSKQPQLDLAQLRAILLDRVSALD